MTNVLRNGSFEGGWFHPDGIPEIQNPDDWVMRWADADTPNPYSDDDWNRFVRPEVRVLSRQFLPEDEQDLFILDGSQTLKVFKGYGAWCLEMVQPLHLEPAMYTFTVRIFGDLVAYYDNGRKHWAPDPNSGLLRFVLNGHAYTDTHSITPGMWNLYSMEFAADGDTSIGAQVMCPFALENSGIFADAWTLVKSLPEGQCRGYPRKQYARTVNVLPHDATWKQASEIFRREGIVGKQTVGYSYDDAGLGDLDDRTAVLWGIPDFARTEYSDWYDKWYPGVKVEFRDLSGEEPPPTPSPEPEPPEPEPPNVIKAGFHLQRPFDNCLDLIRRCADAGKPMAWVKVVQEHLEIIEQIKALSPDTKCMFRYIPRESPAYFIHAPDYRVALDQSTFASMFDRAVELGFDAVETPVNEVIGTHNPDIVQQNVSFDSAYCYWCRDRSGDRVAPAIITPGGGNPDHGYETSLLVPAVRAAIETDGILVPHTAYFTVRPEPNISEEWMHSAQVQYDYHLRSILSWLPTFDDAGIDVSKLRLVFGEGGGVGTYKNVAGLPGGYIDAGAGWRRYDALNGDVVRYVNLLESYEALCQLYPQIEGWVIFTQGYVGWAHFQFNNEWTLLLDRLLQ